MPRRNNNNKSMKKNVLLLHGNRQTGHLLLGRLEKLRKRIWKEYQLGIVAPDAPFPHPEAEAEATTTTTTEASTATGLKTWWNRNKNDYEGLDQTLATILEEVGDGQNDDNDIVGIMGFSQGARLTHLLALLHTADPQNWFPNLKFVILVAGYDAPIPDHFPLQETQQIKVPSLHVWGKADPLISPEQSDAVTKDYNNPCTYEHDGKHYVPTKAADLKVFMNFIEQSIVVEGQKMDIGTSPTTDDTTSAFSTNEPIIASPPSPPKAPDEESAMMQQDEVQALEAIFPDEIVLKSAMRDVDGVPEYDYPVRYEVRLLPADPDDTNTNWPIHPLTLEVLYPYNYPSESIPAFKLLHENDITQFPRCRLERFTAILKESAEMELGMPNVLSCIYAVKEYLDSPPDDTAVGNATVDDRPASTADQPPVSETIADQIETDGQCTIKRSSPDEITKCTLEGLEIAESLLQAPQQASDSEPSLITGKGGSFWTYTIGLVGKPSAGKSTFFNAATAFSRQRGDKKGDPEWGGASMAAHPFTTIDPNVGYCLVPAPEGSCPEDDITGSRDDYGSIHGRDPGGRRFLPVLLKDVAGLVPGAYQGRGRGNQFLNDLTDATVLIHVVDASGTADAQGNTTVTDSDGDVGEFTKPLDDLAWIRNELVEWVYSNLVAKWSSVIRKGQAKVCLLRVCLNYGPFLFASTTPLTVCQCKLSGMFSGYGQNQAMTHTMFSALDKFLEDKYHGDKALDNIALWDQGDIHRVVSAFLGVRFPMALALNKLDLPSSLENAEEIQEALPTHGAHAGTPLAARSEMTFVRNHLATKASDKIEGHQQPPLGVWQCLRSAMMLKQPVLVFPVADMTTYAPLPGMNKNAAENPSLPSTGMLRCLEAAGGSLPSCWKDSSFVLPSKEEGATMKLRDVLLMKPGSTVEDVFQTLKKHNALGGEFVRAESAAKIGDKPKPIPKHAVVGGENRILKIMSNKRTAWQTAMS